MPTEAIENLVLDAIADELAKIGTAPLSNWLTTTAPTIRAGAPSGDKVPGPNKCSIYVHHVGSQEGSDDAGAASHRLDCRFAVWCCASHAGPSGHRRMLNLKRDVVRALRNAENVFFQAFKYGIQIDECSYQGLEDTYFKGGVSACVQYVSVTAENPDDADLRFSAVPLSVDLERVLLRSYPFSALPELERSSAGMEQRLEAPSLVIESTVPGANEFLEARIEGAVSDQWFRTPEGYTWPQFETEISAMICPYRGENPTDTMLSGIEIGTYDQAAPFPSAAAHPVAQLRWNHGQQRWELVSGVGDGVTADLVVPITGLPALTPGVGGIRARLIYDPFTPRLLAVVHGVEVAEITDASRLPKFAAYSSSPLIHGAFVTTGSHAAASVQTIFSACHCKLFNATREPASLWY